MRIFGLQIVDFGLRKQINADCGIKKERNLEIEGLRNWGITIPKP